MIITQTPMRITLAGGGTDVIWYSRLKGGAWISGAINCYVFVHLNPTEDQKSIKIINGDEIDTVDNANSLSNPIVRECFKAAGVDNGVEIYTHSQALPKSGLGGSGAFEVGLLHALYTHRHQDVDKLTLGQEAADIEIVKLNKPVGPQDQYITALGGINYFEIDTSGQVTYHPVSLSPDSIDTLHKNLIFLKTGIQHDTASVLGDQKKQAESKDDHSAVLNSLDDIKALGQKAKQFLETGKIDDFGSTLHSHWLIKKKLSAQVSNPQIDEWYQAGQKFGALGGKIMGAGGGGWLVFYVNSNHQHFIENMEKLGLIHQSVNFDWDGTQIILNQ